MSRNKKSIQIHSAQRVVIEQEQQANLAIFDLKAVSRVEVSAARGRGDVETISEVASDDVMELNLEGGGVLIIRRDDYEDQFQDPDRSASEDTIEIRSIRVGAPSRGFDDWLVRTLEVFSGPAASVSARILCEKFEKKTVEQPGLYRVLAEETETGFRLESLETRLKASDKPLLVFIHGTASSTEGSFGQLLANRELRDRLFMEYGENVYALDHWTLTKSPIENALDLVSALPKDSELHLVSHSRGGLVGELVCRGTNSGAEPITETGFEVFRHQYKLAAEKVDKPDRDKLIKAYAAQEASLKKLNSLLTKKKLKVGRFVRVACPARGTTLASGRLDRWFSVVTSLLGLVPGLKATPWFGVFKAFVTALVRTRTNPRIIPGLEAQMPDSPLIALVNTPAGSLDADLTIISGDTEKSGLLGRLAMLATDRFYDGHHDLVVNTASMYGGGQRSEKPRSFFDKGLSTSHFNYFGNEQTATRVVEGLAGDGSILDQRLPRVQPELHAPIARSHTGPRPIVYLLPGVLGSELAVNGKTIWVNALQLIRGGLGKLSIEKERISPCGVIESSYQRLINYLSEDFEVVPFHYDWRLPLTTEARRLAKSLSESMDKNRESGQPVSIIAHSMGGLVVRAMIASQREVWNRLIEHEQGRFLMLGTPNGGSFSIPRMLVGQDKLIGMLALADLKSSNAELLGIIRRFPGVLNLLPESGGGLDLFSGQAWEQVKSADRNVDEVPAATDLAEARKIRDLLNSVVFSQEPAGKIMYVAGKADATPISMRLEDGKARFSATACGDGRVPWVSGIPHRVPAWYLDAMHGDLADVTSAFEAIKDLVEHGNTDLLPQTPPTVARGVEDVFDLPADEIEYRPNERDIVNAALGASVGVVRTEPVAPGVRIVVTHGDMVFARYPVVTGHYANDGIYSAEKALDKRFDMRLSQRHKLGLYPGELNTCEVIFDPAQKPEGAIVIGLGDVGELNVTRLAATYSTGLREYLLARHQHEKDCENSVPGSQVRGISPLLIGGSSGGMATSDCLLAMLQGVMDANQRIQQDLSTEQELISEIQIIELWEDYAHSIHHSLKELTSNNPQLEQKFVIRDELEQGDGGRFRVRYDEEKDWMQRIQVRETKDGNLVFNTVTNRARIESRIMPNDRSKVDEFIERATASTATSDSVPKTLFEMLLPNDFKSRASTQGHTILQLNQGSARYPWELLEDRWGQAKKPFAVSFKLIRQLESSYFDPNPPARRSGTALVVGAPVLGRRWTPLPGAVREAELVRERLQAHPQFNPVSIIEEDGFRVLEALHTDAYRILHLAGHGVYEYELGKLHNGKPKIESGMVISDDMLLTAEDIDKIRYVPELVFINCCHLGRIENEEQRDMERKYKRGFPWIAANLATQFIRRGARAVVAAGWEVDDAAALTFARKFYDGMLGGANFASAVHDARQETWQAYRNVNTWGAYQCYGDPEFVLCDKGNQNKDDIRFYSPLEMVHRLKSLVSEARTTGKEDNSMLGAITKIETWLLEKKPAWQQQGRLCSALGDAFKEAGEFEKAIEWYQKAIACNDSSCNLKSTEQLANIMVRHAHRQATRHKAGQEAVDRARADITQAIRYLKGLLCMFDSASSITSERLSLIGSAYRCQSLLEMALAGGEFSSKDITEVSRALEEMEHYFYAASWHGQGVQAEFNAEKTRVRISPGPGKSRLPDPYPFLNYLMARYLQHLMTENEQASIRAVPARDLDYLTLLERQYESLETARMEFFTLVSAADGRLVHALLDDEFEHNEDHTRIVTGEIVALYKRAFRPGVSAVQKDSVIKTLKGLLLYCDNRRFSDKSKGERRKKVHAALVGIIEGLEKSREKNRD